MGRLAGDLPTGLGTEGEGTASCFSVWDNTVAILFDTDEHEPAEVQGSRRTTLLTVTRVVPLVDGGRNSIFAAEGFGRTVKVFPFRGIGGTM